MAVSSVNRIASLDFLRSAAILLVLTAHTVLAFGAPDHLAFLQLGGTGVDLFFVLSGWLLGSHLLKELSSTKTIDIRRFWCRRWLRTLPAYFAILALTYAQFLLKHPVADLPLEYLVFGQNYTGMPLLHVSWSLCVEEHFYLLIAPAILLAARNRTVLWTVVAAALTIPFACRQLGLYASMEATHVRFDACAAGVMLSAVCRYFPGVWERLCRNAAWVGGLSLAAYVSLFVWYAVMGAQLIEDPAVFTMISAGFVTFAVSSTIVRQRLTFPMCHYIASRSYAIYLLHPEVLALMKRYGADLPFPAFLAITFCGSCVVAEVLYRLVEKPVMDARDLFAMTRSTERVATVSPEMSGIPAMSASK